MSTDCPEVSIIIVSYNTRELLRGCLESLRRVADEVIFEIIVVDNHSTDGSCEMIRSEFEEVRLIESPNNIGYASGINLARASSIGKYLFVLNPDCLVPRNAIGKLRDFMAADLKRAVAGARITTATGINLPSEFSIPSLFRELWNFLPELKSRILYCFPFLNGRGAEQQSRQPRQVRAISGAAFMIRTSAFDKVGGMDGEFFLYHEELDFCARIEKSGLQVWTVPEAQIIHFDAQASGYSTRSLPGNPVLEWRVLGMDRLWQKHRTPAEHQKWRKQARALLSFRVLLLSLKRMWSSSVRKQNISTRIHELDALRSKLASSIVNRS
jgi:GT2 family glycosyltransferase